MQRWRSINFLIHLWGNRGRFLFLFGTAQSLSDHKNLRFFIVVESCKQSTHNFTTIASNYVIVVEKILQPYRWWRINLRFLHVSKVFIIFFIKKSQRVRGGALGHGKKVINDVFNESHWMSERVAIIKSAHDDRNSFNEIYDRHFTLKHYNLPSVGCKRVFLMMTLRFFLQRL